MNTVTLIDGREVSSDSNEWKIECLARFVADIRGWQKREEWLAGFDKRFGIENNKPLRELVKRIVDDRLA